MRKHAWIILIAPWLLTGCRSDDNPTRFYKDIDLYTFRGKQEISRDDLRYPYIRIDSINPGKKRVGFFNGKGDSLIKEFEKDTVGWVNWSRVHGGGCHIEYEVVPGNGTIVDIEYTYSLCLMDVSLLNFSDSTRLLSYCIVSDSMDAKYVFHGLFQDHRPRATDPAAYPLDKAHWKDERKYSMADGNLFVNRRVTRYDEEFQIIREIRCARCMQMKGLSFIWFHYFPFRFQLCNGVVREYCEE